MATLQTARGGYRNPVQVPHDRQARRNRMGRFVMFIISAFVLLGLPVLLLGQWGWHMGYEGPGNLLGIVTGIALITWLAPTRMLVYNPEWSGYLTNDVFTGRNVAYGPGLHFSYFWENRNKDGNYSLQVITRSRTLGVSTETSRVEAKISYQYAISLRFLDRAVGADETTVENGLMAFIDSHLTEEVARHSADYVRRRVGEFNDSLARIFRQPPESEDSNHPSNIERNFGFTTVAVVIDSITLPDAVQKTRDARDEAAQLFSVAAKIYGCKTDEDEEEFARKVRNREIPADEYRRLLNTAMATSENAGMNIQVIDAGSAGDLLASFAARFGGQSEKQGENSKKRGKK